MLIHYTLDESCNVYNEINSIAAECMINIYLFTDG